MPCGIEKVGVPGPRPVDEVDGDVGLAQHPRVAQGVAADGVEAAGGQDRRGETRVVLGLEGCGVQDDAVGRDGGGRGPAVGTPGMAQPGRGREREGVAPVAGRPALGVERRVGQDLRVEPPAAVAGGERGAGRHGGARAVAADSQA